MQLATLLGKSWLLHGYQALTTGAALPLSDSELSELYNSNIAITADDECEMALFLPETSRLITPTDFELLLAEQHQLRQENLNYGHDQWNEGSWNRPPEEIRSLQQFLMKEAEQLRNITGWPLAAIAAGREGGPRRQVWDDLLNEVHGVYSLAAQA